MSARVVIGQRNTGEYGIWAAPSGKDAMTDSDAQLSLSMGTKYEQIAFVGSSAAGVPVVYSFLSTPNVLLLGSVGGVIHRPYPSQLFGGAGANGYAVITNTQFTMSYAGSYVVFKRSYA